MQIDFSAAFDRVNHLGILYKLCFVGIGGYVLSILTQFLSNRSQQVMVDGVCVVYATQTLCCILSVLYTVLSILEALCCLYWCSSYLIDHSMF